MQADNGSVENQNNCFGMGNVDNNFTASEYFIIYTWSSLWYSDKISTSL